MKNAFLKMNDLEALLERHGRALEQLMKLLLAENTIHNLTRITEPASIRVRHFLDSLAALKILETAADGGRLTCADVGSGAGFPVFPLAIARPQWTFVSIEATGKKAAFQRKVCTALRLENVEVVSARAEELAYERGFREQFDAVLVRAVADLSIAAELALGLVRVGGRMIAWKGPKAEEEVKKAAGALEQMGAGKAETFDYVLPTQPEPAVMMLVCAPKKAPTAAHLPRSFAQIKHKPLGTIS